ncbi:MAG: hypothetical protein BGO31_12420 [Bacteroidetes bacterium 43-16]|nr:MAG: hypothetical protein BGO31_12420 [Bacteroidetes bacterium 43-16]
MKNFRFVLLLALSCCFSLSQAQDLQKIEKEKLKLELFEEEPFHTPLSEKYTGKVVFSKEELTRELPESKYINTYTLGDKLSIRAYFEHSVANSMLIQLVESGKKAKEVNQNKSWFKTKSKYLIFLYLDGNEIAGTSYAEDFSEESMTSFLSLRADLNDGTEKIFFGESLYKALLLKQDVLTPGKHKLRFEFVPIKTWSYGSDFKYQPIAVGEIDMIVPKEIKLNTTDCFPQKVLDDPKLEQEALKATKVLFKTNAANALKAILPFQDVYIIRDEYGNIVKKSFMAAIACKSDKEVWYDYYIFDKMYDGTKYLDAVVSKDITLNGYTTPSGKNVHKDCLKFLK